MTSNSGAMGPPGAGTDELGLESAIGDTAEKKSKLVEDIKHGARLILVFALLMTFSAFVQIWTMQTLEEAVWGAGFSIIVLGPLIGALYFQQRVWAPAAIFVFQLCGIVLLLMEGSVSGVRYSVTGMLFDAAFVFVTLRTFKHCIELNALRRRAVGR